ncbi:hypothetical protein BJF80_06650 [Serinicoccus sp. CUA-874]|uniref:TY-Chap domain-containing protein n=1 Tax=Serinicoccus sp. CUA-874 TaxID=1517939 RepID=UPI00095BED05|nr:hypothetical protein [Serinicoccus sp. CUA-874]OLT16268.1 hypothetical protein BJF80_06650 [Serinicoccus sp. CUA-874]
MDDAAWTRTLEELTAEIGALGDHESLLLAEPDPPGAIGRYVQVSRLGDDLLCECVSAAYADLSPEQTAALQRAGWSDPDRQPRGATSENHVFWGRVEDAASSAHMLVAALQTLGTGIPDERWTRQRVS